MHLTNIKAEERDLIDDLLRRSGHKTQIDLINEALALYSHQLQIIEEGGGLPQQEHPSGVLKEIAIPSFLQILTKAKKLKIEADRAKTGS